MWKPLPSRRVLKILRESSKEKVERGQYLLAVDLGHYFACQVAVGESISQVAVEESISQVAVEESIVLLSQVAVGESIVSRGEIIRRLSVAGGWMDEREIVSNYHGHVYY